MSTIDLFSTLIVLVWRSLWKLVFPKQSNCSTCLAHRSPRSSSETNFASRRADSCGRTCGGRHPIWVSGPCIITSLRGWGETGMDVTYIPWKKIDMFLEPDNDPKPFNDIQCVSDEMHVIQFFKCSMGWLTFVIFLQDPQQSFKEASWNGDHDKPELNSWFGRWIMIEYSWMFFSISSYEITWIPSLKLTSPLKMDLLILKLVFQPSIFTCDMLVSGRFLSIETISFDWWKLDVSPNPLGQLMSTMGRDVSEPWRGRGQKSEGFTMESFLNIMISNLGNWQLKYVCLYFHHPLN